MESQGLDCTPEQVANIKGDEARAHFVNAFKEVQRCKTQLDQYTDLSEEERTTIEEVLPEDRLRGFLAPIWTRPSDSSFSRINTAMTPARSSSLISSLSSSPPPSLITTTSWG